MYERITRDIRRGRRRLTVGLWIVTALFITAEYLRPPYGRKLMGEIPLWTYASALQFTLAGATALLAALLTLYQKKLDRPTGPRPWFLTAAGLVLVLMGADEMLKVHEKIGQHFKHSPFMQKVELGGYTDNVIILFYGLLGLTAAALTLREMLRDRLGTRYYALSAGMAMFAVLCDYLPRGDLAGHLPTATEEIAEMLFAVSLTSAFISHISLAAQGIIRTAGVSKENSAHPAGKTETIVLRHRRRDYICTMMQ